VEPCDGKCVGHCLEGCLLSPEKRLEIQHRSGVSDAPSLR
jgi:hypothetical protein